MGTLRADDTPAGSSPPKGELRKYTFEQSKIFPGTMRDYSIYVPKQYDPAKPACLYVNQDGIQYRAPTASIDIPSQAPSSQNCSRMADR